jgi:hypothetical protein
MKVCRKNEAKLYKNLINKTDLLVEEIFDLKNLIFMYFDLFKIKKEILKETKKQKLMNLNIHSHTNNMIEYKLEDIINKKLFNI